MPACPQSPRRQHRLLAAAVLIFAAVSFSGHDVHDTALPESVGRPFSFSDLHFELWRRDLAPALSADQKQDFVMRQLLDLIQPTEWRDLGGTEGTVKLHESTISGCFVVADRCQEAGDL
jgi:hypothetical protein